jgi:hypothetical protein
MSSPFYGNVFVQMYHRQAPSHQTRQTHGSRTSFMCRILESNATSNHTVSRKGQHILVLCPQWWYFDWGIAGWFHYFSTCCWVNETPNNPNECLIVNRIRLSFWCSKAWGTAGIKKISGWDLCGGDNCLIQLISAWPLQVCPWHWLSLLAWNSLISINWS